MDIMKLLTYTANIINIYLFKCLSKCNVLISDLNDVGFDGAPKETPYQNVRDTYLEANLQESGNCLK